MTERRRPNALRLGGPMRALAFTFISAGCAARTPHEETVERASDLMQTAPGRGGQLSLRCDPPDAVVEVDGVPQGVCEDFDGRTRRLTLGEGMRHVVVKKDGFWPYETWYQSGGATATLAVSLRPRVQSEGER